jgi:hypothetical protein
MGNFIIADNEYQDLGQAYSELFSRLSDMHTQYTTTLSTLVDSGISSGRVATNLRVFKETAQRVESEFNGVAPIVTPATSDVVSTISRADSRS